MNDKPYLLLAEDDPDDQFMFIHELATKNPGIRVTCVSDGEELLAYLEGCETIDLPDIILMDYKMPRMSAIDVLEQLCNNGRYTQIPMLVWSTSGRTEYQESCLSRGVRQFFKKPDGLQELADLADCVVQMLEDSCRPR